MRHFWSIIMATLIVFGLFFAVFHALLSAPSSPEQKNEIHAIWISFVDLSMTESKGNSEAAFREKTETMLNNITANGLDTVFLHVRPFSDAIYRSKIYPWSAYISGCQGVDPGYDPLQIFCETAKQHHVQVHAWINPFRICSDEAKWDDVSEDNPAKPSRSRQR